MTSERERELWERQPGETNAAWAAFQVYRDIAPGQRTLLDAYRTAKGPRKDNVCGTWRRWVQQYNWKARAEAYDLHVDEKVRLELEQRRLVAKKETADLGRAMRKKAEEALAVLRAVGERVEEKDGEQIKTEEPNLDPWAVARLATAGVSLERLALGEPQTTTDVTSGGGRVVFVLPEKGSMDEEQ